jgi:hypothetical protein
MSEDIVERMRFWSKTRNDNPTAWNLDCGYAADAIERLTAERDEARREYCFAFAELTTEPTWEPPTHEQAAKLVANKRGWSCFKEDGK